MIRPEQLNPRLVQLVCKEIETYLTNRWNGDQAVFYALNGASLRPREKLSPSFAKILDAVQAELAGAGWHSVLTEVDGGTALIVTIAPEPAPEPHVEPVDPQG